MAKVGREDDIIMTVFTYQALYRAYVECRRHKRATRNALAFEYQLEGELATLLQELRSRTYQPRRSLCFVVTKPKPREIFAADFRDRIVHHLLVREILPLAEAQFSYDSFACRPGKGTHRAVDYLRHHIKSFGRGTRVYFLQLDIKAFFPNIHKDILFSLTERLIHKSPKSASWKEELLWLSQLVILHDPTDRYVYRGDPLLRRLVPQGKSLMHQPQGRGLPIGNYTSQFFANLFLDRLDQFIKREIRCRRYVRYVDDLILLDTSTTALVDARRSISRFLRMRLDLRLHPRKMRLQSIEKGIDFLGYFIKPEYMLVRRRVVGRLRGILGEIQHTPTVEVKKVVACINSYYGHFRYARSFHLREDLFKHRFGIWRVQLEPAGGQHLSFRPLEARKI